MCAVADRIMKKRQDTAKQAGNAQPDARRRQGVPIRRPPALSGDRRTVAGTRRLRMTL
jgi:hypothetical protein